MSVLMFGGEHSDNSNHNHVYNSSNSMAMGVIAALVLTDIVFRNSNFEICCTFW